MGKTLLDYPDPMTLSEAAEFMQRDRQVVYDWILKKALVGVFIGKKWYVTKSDLETFLHYSNNGKVK